MRHRVRLTTDTVHIKHVRELAPLTIAAVTDSVVSLQSNLQTMPAANRYLAGYMRYKINRVKFTFIPRVSEAVVGAVDGIGFVFSIDNPNGAMLPLPTVDAALNNSRARRHAFNRPFSIYFKPKIINLISEDVSTANVHATPIHAGYLDCLNDSTIIHYGADVLISNPAIAVGATWDVLETLYVSYQQRTGV